MRGGVAKRIVGVALMLAATAMLTACGGSYGFDANAPSKATMLGNLLAFNSVNAPSPTPPPVDAVEPALSCPPIEVVDGTASSRVYGSAEQTNQNVKYQFSMGDTVRECSHVGNDIVLKVGVEGRALLGPVGAPGSFSAPVRIAVRSERTDKPVVSKLYPVPVTIAPGDTSVGFSIVPEAITVPYLSARGDDDYTILVGFDSQGSGKLDAKPRPKKRRQG